MTTIALQIAADGLSWSRMPDPLDLDGENAVTGHRAPWPHLPHPWYRGGALPNEMAERIRTYGVVAEIIEDADVVLLAVEEGADRRRVGIAEVALEAVGCQVVEVAPHPDGAAGLIREVVEGIVRTSPRPPGL